MTPLFPFKFFIITDCSGCRIYVTDKDSSLMSDGLRYLSLSRFVNNVIFSNHFLPPTVKEYLLVFMEIYIAILFTGGTLWVTANNYSTGTPQKVKNESNIQRCSVKIL
jgi:hypothetical protein